MTNYSHAHHVGSSCTSIVRTSLSDRLLVLVVEDHEDTRFLLRVLLERRGIRVVEAEDGVAGVRAAEEFHPDLILMDWSLPHIDGLAATRLIHERNSLSQIPVVFLSGHAAPASQKAAREAGCCEYLVKPIDLDQLDRLLRRHLLLHVISTPVERAHVYTRGTL
jgi:CheY-like chemotaxis protein